MELGEIEKVINDDYGYIIQYRGGKRKPGGQFLCAYFTAQGIVDKAALTQHLATLTYYMVLVF